MIKCLLPREWPLARCVMRRTPCNMPIAPALAFPRKGKEMEGTQTLRGARVRLCFPAVMVALVCGGTSSAQTTPWKDYLGGPAASHYSPLKQINTGNVNKLDVAWTYPTGDDVSYTFSPLVVDNIAYFAAKQGSLVAVNATTGKELWIHAFTTAAGVPSRFGVIAGLRGANYWESKDRTDRRLLVSSG